MVAALRGDGMVRPAEQVVCIAIAAEAIMVGEGMQVRYIGQARTTSTSRRRRGCRGVGCHGGVLRRSEEGKFAGETIHL
jgi:hypothetical protein